MKPMKTIEITNDGGFTELYRHYGHKVVVARYTDEQNQPIAVAVECEECFEVLLNYEKG
jgi:hypothetical protein